MLAQEARGHIEFAALMPNVEDLVECDGATFAGNPDLHILAQRLLLAS
jgi:hypothetical protein